MSLMFSYSCSALYVFLDLNFCSSIQSLNLLLQLEYSPPQAILCFIRPWIKTERVRPAHRSGAFPQGTQAWPLSVALRWPCCWPADQCMGSDGGGGEAGRRTPSLPPSCGLEALSLCKLSSCGNSGTAPKINGISWQRMGKANFSAIQGLSLSLEANCPRPLQWVYLPENIQAVSQ